MNEPTITCPHCNTEIGLTESLAAPLIRTAREQYEKRIAQKEDNVARRESAIAAQRAKLATAVESIEKQVISRLKIEREIAAEEAKKAQVSELESRSHEVAHLQQELQERDNELAEAQQARTEFIRKKQEFEDAKRQFDLQIETRVQESLSDIRHKAKQEAENALKLNIEDKEKQIASMQQQLKDLEVVYQYLRGPRFRQRLEAIVEKFSNMQTDLERERKMMTRLRAKREGQIREVIGSTVAMYGDFQEIAGKTLEEIEGLSQIARRVEARRKRGPTRHRVEPIATRCRTH